MCAKAKVCLVHSDTESISEAWTEQTELSVVTWTLYAHYLVTSHVCIIIVLRNPVMYALSAYKCV